MYLIKLNSFKYLTQIFNIPIAKLQGIVLVIFSPFLEKLCYRPKFLIYYFISFHKVRKKIFLSHSHCYYNAHNLSEITT